VLEGLDAVRKRPGMYIGSTGPRGLHHLVYEIVDNSVDEALAGFCDTINVTITKDGWIRCQDNGRGIPVSTHPTEGISTVQVVLTILHAGGKFGGGGYAVSGGLHGVGASVVNALSTKLRVAVAREGHFWTQQYTMGVPDDELKQGPKTDQTGTLIEFLANPDIFETVEYDYETLRARFQQMCFLNKGLTISLEDERTGKEDSYCYENGLKDYVEYLNASKKSEIVNPEIISFEAETKQKNMSLELAMQWTNAYNESVHTYANTINTHEGGTHEEGFRTAITSLLNKYAREKNLLREKDENLSGDDCREGLTCVISVKLSEPQFEGQTKEILGTPAAQKIVATVVTDEFIKWFKNPPRGDKAKTKVLLEKIANAARARIAARNQRDVQRRKNAIESSSLPAKLADCRSNDVENSELFIVEGDSALGTAKLARNSEYQALLPIRGKILNVQKASVADVLKNAECASIISVVGGGSGKTFELEEVRYCKIILMSDADVDGAHIRCLLLTLFHRYMKPLLDSGRVFAAVPPLHRIETVASGKKSGEIIYTYSDEEMKKTVSALEKSGQKIKQPIQRYKGLGEMDAKQLRETTMNRDSRTLRRITVKDAEEASEVFDLLMGTDVGPRKEFIVHGADELDKSRIDA